MTRSLILGVVAGGDPQTPTQSVVRITMRLCRRPRTLEFLSPPCLGRQSMRVSSQLADASVDTAHLLVGMLREGSGVAGSVLASHNIDAEAIDAEAVLKFCKSFDDNVSSRNPMCELSTL